MKVENSFQVWFLNKNKNKQNNALYKTSLKIQLKIGKAYLP